MLEKYEKTHKRRSPILYMDETLLVDQEKNDIHQLCADIKGPSKHDSW